MYISNIEIKDISNILHESFITRILSDICKLERFPKLCTYKKFKFDFRLENHLLTLENRVHQIAVSKFRISSHNLRIETGHYETNPKLEPHERLCIYCDRQIVENEKHFLLECPLYDDDRNALLQICAIEIENCGNIGRENKFIEIMNNKNAIVIAALGKYVYNSMIKCSTANPSEHSKKEKAKKKIKPNNQSRKI